MLANLQELLGTTNATAIDMAALNADENEKKWQLYKPDILNLWGF